MEFKVDAETRERMKSDLQKMLLRLGYAYPTRSHSGYRQEQRNILLEMVEAGECKAAEQSLTAQGNPSPRGKNKKQIFVASGGMLPTASRYL